MKLSKQSKQTYVRDLAAKMGAARSLVLAQYRGLNVAQTQALRQRARAAKVELRVIKNSLASRAVVDTPFAALRDDLKGPLIYGFATDVTSAAKVLSDFAKENEQLVITAGVCEGQRLGADAIKDIARIPSREVLLSQLLGLLQSPISGLARVLAAVAVKRGGDAPAAAPAA